MQSREQIATTFIQIIQPFVRGADVSQISEETRLVEDLKVNSARMVDIILETEDRFGISIDDYSADSMRTIGDAIALITARRAHS